MLKEFELRILHIGYSNMRYLDTNIRVAIFGLQYIQHAAITLL